MERGPFLDDRLQEEFSRFVEILLHTDGKDARYRESSVRNRRLQKERFGTVALPYYAIVDPFTEKVYWQAGGVFDADEFLEAFRKARAAFEAER